MILLSPSPPTALAATTRGVFMRELVSRADRVPRDERVDLPEIQESFRVSFSNDALAAAAGRSRDAAQRPTFTDARGAADDPRVDPRLRAYRSIAAL